MPPNGKKQKGSKSTVVYALGGPSVKEGVVEPCFEDGRCYRIMKKDKWYFYNDTLNYEMHVKYTFSPDSKVKPMGKSEMRKVGPSWREITAVVYPMQTVPFVSGKMEGFKGSTNGVLLSGDYVRNDRTNADREAQMEYAAVKSACASKKTDEERLYECRKKKKIPFVDMTFQPNTASLRRSPDIDKREIPITDKISWRRPQDCVAEGYQKKIKLFQGKLNPRNINQGQLGDCWVICSIAALSENKKLTKSIFAHPISESKAKKERKYGAFRAQINKGGIWRNVILDSYLPTICRMLCFARCEGDAFSMWVSALEKAYAKVNGSYSAIIGGDSRDALEDFTGFPTCSLKTMWEKATKEDEKASVFFKKLLRYEKKGYIVTITTPGVDRSAYTGNGNGERVADAKEKMYKHSGLGMGHAYSVLSVKQYNMPNIKLMKIRNPWGSGAEWRGDWSANSTTWNSHPFVKRSCNPAQEPDGSFWMEWKDVFRYFDGGAVCFLQKGWFDYRIPGEFVNNIPNLTIRVDVKKKTKAIVSLAQRDRRGAQQMEARSLYLSLLISVSHVNPTAPATQIIAANSTDDVEVSETSTFTYVYSRSIGMEIEFDPKFSPYYIFPRARGSAVKQRDFTLGLLTENKSSIQGNIDISFKTLPVDSPAYRNTPTFQINHETPLTCQFQQKKTGKCAQWMTGESVGKSKECVRNDD